MWLRLCEEMYEAKAQHLVVIAQHINEWLKIQMISIYENTLDFFSKAMLKKTDRVRRERNTKDKEGQNVKARVCSHLHIYIYIFFLARRRGEFVIKIAFLCVNKARLLLSSRLLGHSRLYFR